MKSRFPKFLLAAIAIFLSSLAAHAQAMLVPPLTNPMSPVPGWLQIIWAAMCGQFGAGSCVSTWILARLASAKVLEQKLQPAIASWMAKNEADPKSWINWSNVLASPMYKSLQWALGHLPTMNHLNCANALNGSDPSTEAQLPLPKVPPGGPPVGAPQG